MFGRDVNVVLISLMNDAKVFLYRTMFRMDKYLHTDFTGVLRKQNGTLQPMRLIPYKLLKIHSSTVYDALYDDAKKIVPKYKKNRANRVKKYPDE